MCTGLQSLWIKSYDGLTNGGKSIMSFAVILAGAAVMAALARVGIPLALPPPLPGGQGGGGRRGRPTIGGPLGVRGVLERRRRRTTTMTTMTTTMAVPH
jgi:hypothetical protein